MSKAFKGLKEVRRITAEVSKSSGIGVTVSTVSAEPYYYREGEYSISRAQWEDELIKLFDAYAPRRDNSWREYGVDFENEIFWVHIDYQHFTCKCGYKEDEWGGLSDEDRNKSHLRECEWWWVDKPNFFHKPSGYGLFWYKYPCREAYGNQIKTLEEFQSIIQECIESLK